MSDKAKARLVVTRPYWVDLADCPPDTVCASKGGGTQWQFDAGCVLPTATAGTIKTVVWDPAVGDEPAEMAIRLRRFGGAKVSNFSQTGRCPKQGLIARIHDIDPSSLDFSRCNSNVTLPLLPVGTRFKDKTGRGWTIFNNSGGRSNYHVLRDDDAYAGLFGAKLMYGHQRSVRSRDSDAVLSTIKLPLIAAGSAGAPAVVDVSLGRLDPLSSTFVQNVTEWLATIPAAAAPTVTSITTNGNPLYW